MTRKVLEIVCVVILGAGVVFYFYTSIQPQALYGPEPAPADSNMQPPPEEHVVTSTSTVTRPPDIGSRYPLAYTTIDNENAYVVAEAEKSFAYAHGTVMADDRFFVGVEDRGITFANHIAAFVDPTHLDRYVLLDLPQRGSVETMVYDQSHDEIYFLISATGKLGLFEIDPHTLRVSVIASSTELDTGPRPAIVTDGTYVYGITNTDPAKVFKILIADGSLTHTDIGHIPNGHSAAIGIYGSSTELYFGGNLTGGFEKVDANDLKPLATVDLGLCGLSDDAAYSRIAGNGGYVYEGCEIIPFGYRIRTADMQVTKFTLPGSSLGMFIYGNDLYNAARDGNLDIFRGIDLGHLTRYIVNEPSGKEKAHAGGPFELNELFYSATTNSPFFTAWWGVSGIFQISTSTPPVIATTTVATTTTSTSTSSSLSTTTP